MVIVNPADALAGVESLLQSVADLLVDAEGVAHDGGLTRVEARTQELQKQVDNVLAEIRSQIAGMARK